MAEDRQEILDGFARVLQALTEQGHRLDEIDAHFERVDRRFEHRFNSVDRGIFNTIDTSAKMANAVGEAAGASSQKLLMRIMEVELELRDLRSRLRKLEAKV
jgi:hypothetical protein